MTRPIGVTDNQLGMIMRACEPLLPADRDPFLRALAHQLSGEPQPLGDGVIFRTIKTLQRGFWKPPQVEKYTSPARHEPRDSRRVVGPPLA